MQPPVQIVFVGSHLMKAQHVFNANAFPDATSNLVGACSSRLALLFLHMENLPRAIIQDRSELLGALDRLGVDLEKSVANRPDLTFVARSDGLAYIAEMHSCLNALKSYLDIYAKLIGKLIKPEETWAFNKGNVEGNKLAGGKFVNNLRNCSGVEFADQLASLTLEQSLSWISTAVTYRDQLSHRSDLDHMNHMQLQLYCEPPHFRLEELEEPKMPNGESVASYFKGLLEEVVKYTQCSIVLVPNVKLDLVNSDQLGK